jgi:hypothetical protein
MNSLDTVLSIKTELLVKDNDDEMKVVIDSIQKGMKSEEYE